MMLSCENFPERKLTNILSLHLFQSEKIAGTQHLIRLTSKEFRLCNFYTYLELHLNLSCEVAVFKFRVNSSTLLSEDILIMNRM